MYFTNNFIRVRPTHDEICEVWYRISREDVDWVLEKCSVYALDEDKQGKAVVKPIETRCCIDRIEFDLIDFRSLSNSKYTWILQIKDTFSQHVWLYALKNKSSNGLKWEMVKLRKRVYNEKAAKEFGITVPGNFEAIK